MKHRTIKEIYKAAHTYAEFDLVPNEDSTITAMKLYAEQDACEFFKWYGVKMMQFMEYFKRKLENPMPYSIPDGYDKFIEEFEGNTVEGLYKIYSEWKIV